MQPEPSFLNLCAVLYPAGTHAPARPLRDDELLRLWVVARPLCGTGHVLTAAANHVAEVLAAPDVDVLAQAAPYVVFGVTDARDLALPENPAATARLQELAPLLRLDEPLCGPVLVIHTLPAPLAPGATLPLNF